jgi:hypothetical protein
MMSVLYQHILKHVQHYSLRDNSTTVEMIKVELIDRSFDSQIIIEERKSFIK